MEIKPIRNLLVDLDGTLLGNRQLPLTVDFIRRSISHLKKYGGARKAFSTLVAIQKEFNRPHKTLTNDHRVIGLFAERMKIDIDEGRKVLREGVLGIFPELKRHFFPVSGSREFLDWAQKHYPLYLATNPVWPTEIQELRVRWAGIDPKIFQSITHVRRMHACKPSPEYYEEILAQEKLKAEDCMLIGDERKMDLPATRVGIRVFIVGDYKTLTTLKLPRAKAPAWRGSYKHLRKFLETQSYEKQP